jgi:hypothetical protein
MEFSPHFINSSFSAGVPVLICSMFNRFVCIWVQYILIHCSILSHLALRSYFHHLLNPAIDFHLFLVCWDSIVWCSHFVTSYCCRDVQLLFFLEILFCVFKDQPASYTFLRTLSRPFVANHRSCTSTLLSKSVPQTHDSYILIFKNIKNILSLEGAISFYDLAKSKTPLNGVSNFISSANCQFETLMDIPSLFKFFQFLQLVY